MNKMKYKAFKIVLILSTVLLLSGCSGRKDTSPQGTEQELQTEATERQTETATEETEGASSRPEETTTEKETTSAEEETTTAMESSVESSAVPSVEETAGEEETVNLYQENFDPYENMRSVLSDQTAFLYCGGTTMRWLDEFEGETVTLSGFLELIETTDYVTTKADKSTWKFRCVDLDGDNIKECIIKTDLIYYSVLVFHYRMGHISMYVFPYRNATVFYSNGIIEGSGSASSVYFCRMHFSGMDALLEDVAGTTQFGWLVTDKICAWIPVDGVRTEVTEPEFEAWLNANREEFLGEPAPEYDFTPENINMYVTE